MAECKRHSAMDMSIQKELLNAHRPTDDGFEIVEPKAVALICWLTQKPASEGIMVLRLLKDKYPVPPDYLVPEIDQLIEGARLRAEKKEK